MRLQLIYLSVVALATFAAPLVGLHDRLDGEHTSLAQPHDSRDSEPASLAVRNEARSLSRSLLPLLDEFDMQKTFLLEDPPSKGTRVVPSNAMTAVPTDIEFVTGKFNPDAIIKAAQDRLMVDPPTYDTIATVLAATAHTADLVKSPISGEAGLTHVLYQQLGGPLNAILAAVAQGDWSVRGKGDAPIEDWRFIVNQDKRAVLELKTSHALTGSAVKTIMRLVRAKGFKMAKVRDDNKAIVNSLVDKTAPAKKEPTRTKRGKHVLALEQVCYSVFVLLTRSGRRRDV